ncbi:MAG TPA: prolyl oligopeptidase family serine peptidase [Methylomirabilota bacterium]
MNAVRAWTLALLVFVALWLPVPCWAQTSRAGISKTRVTFKSDNLTLVGFLFKPDGPGPFPALVWNHGSEKNPGTSPQFDAVAAIFVPAGYVVFAPMRRGHGYSEGPYIMDQLRRARQPALAVRLLEGEHLDDQLAGLAYVKSLPYVDPRRLVAAGCSFGGIQTLLAAERNVGYRAAVAISPGAQTWSGNPAMRDRLVAAVRKAEIPVFLIQPPQDASLEPSRVLGAELERRGKQNQVKVYPPDMPEDQQGHCFGGARGMHVWAADVLAFFAGALR